MCDHENREAAMTTVREGTPERLGRDGIWCDPCLAPLITALNDGGLATVASCCGHGEPGRPGWVMLSDGRYLLVLPDQATAHRIEALLKTSAEPGGSDHG